jgi:ribosomal protein L37E
METMLKYGIMQAWDEKTRAWEQENRDKRKQKLTGEKKVVVEILGAFRENAGSSSTWRYGRIVVTDTRFLVYHELFDKVLLEIPIDHIKGISQEEVREFATQTRRELHLLTHENQWHRITAWQLRRLKNALESTITNAGEAVWDISNTETETCPRCGRLDFVKTLLNEGCPDCGWTRALPAVKNLTTG